MKAVKYKRELGVGGWSAVAVVVAAVVSGLVFLQAVGFDYINLDDYRYIFYNRQVKAGLTFETIKWAIWAKEHGGIWMPLTWWSYMVDSTLLGVAPASYHVTNIVLHSLNSGLFFLLLELLLRELVPGVVWWRRLVGCLVATLFWSIHPLRVEPVVWIASRKDVLSCFWELAALLLWAKMVVTRRLWRQGIFYVAALGCFGLAGMAKPTAITFPILAMAVELLLSRRIAWWRLWVPLLIVVGIGYPAARAQLTGGATLELATVPLYGRLVNAVAAVGIYCWKTVWPTGLAVPYMHRWPEWPLFFGWGVVICIGIAWLWVAGCAGALRGVVRLLLLGRRGVGGEATSCLTRLLVRLSVWIRWLSSGAARVIRWPVQLSGVSGQEIALPGFVGLTWFIVAVGPMLGLMNFGYHSHADRFTYVPSLGISVVVAFFWVLTQRRWLAMAMVVMLLPLGIATWLQVGVWQSDFTLFSHTLEVTGENLMAHRNLAIYMYSRYQDHEAALQHVRATLDLTSDPNHGLRAWYVLLLAESGRLAEATAEAAALAEVALKDSGRESMDVLLAFAAVAWFEGDRELARRQCEKIVGRVLKHPSANYLLGLMAEAEGRSSEAVTYWERAIEGDFHYAFVERRIEWLRNKGE